MKTRALIPTFFLFIALILAFYVYPQGLTLEDSLVAYYPFNGDAHDASGNENHGAPVGGVSLTTDRFGNDSSAYYFDGIDDGINVLDNDLLDVNDFTITAWFYAESIPTEPFSLINKPRIEGGSGYGIEFWNSSIHGYIQNPEQYYVGSGVNPLLNNWYFIALTLDFNDFKIYINDSLKGTSYATYPQVSNWDMTIGYMENIGRYWNGKIDDIRIYNCALDSTQISQLYIANGYMLNLPDTLMACHEETIELDAGAGYSSYLWSTGEATQTILVTQTETYSVTVEDDFNNTATDSTYVNIINAHIAQSDTAICPGENIELSVGDGGSASITGGLVGYWPFNGDANDESGNGNDGTVYQATSTTDRFGVENSAYYFDGIDDYIEILSNDGFAFDMGAFSIGAWVKTNDITSTGAGRDDISTKGDPTISGFSISIRNNKAAFFVGPSGEFFGSSTLNNDNWHFIYGIRDLSNNVKLYVDGILEISGTNSESVTTPHNLFSGKHGTLNESYFTGSIDDIRIYNRALAESEISELFNEGTDNYSYLWSTGDTTATISVSPTDTTTYYVEITNGINWCTDSVTVTVECTDEKELELKAFLEGPFFDDEMTPLLNIFDEIPITQPYNTEPWNYDGDESVAEISSFNEIDWVLVELLAPAIDSDGFELLAQRAGFITANGSVKDLDGINNILFYDVEETEFYVRIYHRNHLQITSSVAVTNTDNIYSYDFTTNADKAIGGIRVQKELNTGVWGTMAGDGDANGQIDNKDKNDVWLVELNTTGYLAGDFDMNRQVSDVDKNSYWEFNAGKGILEDTLEIVVTPYTCGDPLIDTRDGQSYNTVQIGDQCWLAENLNVGTMINGNENQQNNSTIEKYCYDNDPANCATYGGLYQWDEMMQYNTTQGAQGICPPDWHLPTDEEWKQLEGTVDSQYGYPDPEWDEVWTLWRGYDAGLNLKSLNGWYLGGNGTDLFGFYALPGGWCSNIGFSVLGSHGDFWSSTEGDTDYAWYRRLNYDFDKIYRTYDGKSYGFSARCLQD